MTIVNRILFNNILKKWPISSTITRSNSSTSQKAVYSPLSECIKKVKIRDYENYLCLLLVNDNELKRFGLALRAFNSEIASIKDVAKNKDVTQFRFVYWNQIIDDLFDKGFKPPANEPITTELKRSLDKVNYKLSIQWFKRLIDSRKNNLNNFPFSTTKELEIYQEQTVSPIYYLLIEYAIRLNSFKNLDNLSKIRIDLDHIASHLGTSQGLLNTLRGLYRNALVEECFIPNDLLAKHNCSHEDIIRLCYEINKSINLNKKLDQDQLEKFKFKGIIDIVFDIAKLSKQNLETSIKLFNKLDLKMKSVNYIFLSIYIQRLYLNDLESNNFNIFDGRIFVNRKPTLPFRLYLNSFEFNKLK